MFRKWTHLKQTSPKDAIVVARTVFLICGAVAVASRCIITYASIGSGAVLSVLVLTEVVFAILFLCALAAMKSAARARTAVEGKGRLVFHSSLDDALAELNKGSRFNGWYLCGYYLFMVTVECIRLAGAPLWLWFPAILLFAIPEFHGLMIGKHTFSQTVWVFQRTGSRARGFVFAGGWVFWLVGVMTQTAWNINPFSLTIGGIPAPEFCLVTGVALWLLTDAGKAIAHATEWNWPWQQAKERETDLGEDGG